jgi:hypothetical protein
MAEIAKNAQRKKHMNGVKKIKKDFLKSVKTTEINLRRKN